MSKFQVKSESGTALLRVLENCRIQDRIESATEVASQLRQRAWITTRKCKECEKRASSMQALDNAKTDENALGYMKVSETDECENKGDEWKKLSDQAKEPCQKKYEAVKAQYDRDPVIFLTNGGTKEKGTAALRKETLQPKEFKKASKDKDAPKRTAGGVFGQLLAEKREEIKKSLSADHKITNVIKKAGERWKSLQAQSTRR